MSSSNFSIDNILAAAKSFSPSTTAMMFNAQQAFIALNSLPASIPSPIDFFNPYAFPPTTSQNSAFAAAQFPFWLAAGFPQHPYLGNPYPSPFYPAAINGKRKRRHRTIFSEHQLRILENTFNTQTQYPDVQLRDRLAAECQLKEERVEVWFKNRRAKDRKKNPEDKKSSNKAGSGASGDGRSPEGSVYSDDEEQLSDASDTEQVSPSRPQKRKRSNSISEAKESKCAKIEVNENTPATINVKLTPKKIHLKAETQSAS